MMIKMIKVMMMIRNEGAPASVSFQISLGKFPMQVKIRPGQTVVTGSNDDHDDDNDDYDDDDDDDKNDDKKLNGN